MKHKRLVKALLFPPVFILLLLFPVAAVLLVSAMLFKEADSPFSIAAYVLSAYTLTVLCLQMPALCQRLRKFKAENKYAKRWQSDPRLRLKLSLYGALLANVAYGALHLGLGFYYRTAWFFSLSGYYLALAVMRFFLLRYTRTHAPLEDMRAELSRYRACGVIFLVMNLALSLMIFFMVYWNRGFSHHEITTIAIAAYTFIALTLAILNSVKYRRYKSPVYSASGSISLAAACVSMLTLEAAMLTAFGDAGDLLFRRVMLGASGGAVSVFIVTLSLYMILRGTQQLQCLKEETKNERQSKR